jgi:hypothetical protein
MKGFFKSRLVLTLVTLVLLAGAIAASLAGITHSRAAAAASTPSGERIHGQSTLEPVFDDTTGNVNFVMTPNNAPNPVNSNPKSWAPFYVPVYPLSASASVGTLMCTHIVNGIQSDNCPDHGPGVSLGAAAAAAHAGVTIYGPATGPAAGSGVLGHDHLMAPPGSGGDFNIAWEPILVLFTNAAAANHRLTTLAEITAAEANKDAFEVPLPQLTFHCEVVPAGIYARSTPVTPV